MKAEKANFGLVLFSLKGPKSWALNPEYKVLGSHEWQTFRVYDFWGFGWKELKVRKAIFTRDFLVPSALLKVTILAQEARVKNLGQGLFERKSKPKRPKWKEMKAQKAKMKGNEGPKGQNERKSRPNRPKWKEMKAQKAKMKGNEGPKGQKLQNAAGLGADKICLNLIRKRAVFGNLWGGPTWQPRQAKNERKWRPKRPKWKEIKAQKAKMKGNEGPKGQNARKMKAQKAKMKGNEGPEA